MKRSPKVPHKSAASIHSARPPSLAKPTSTADTAAQLKRRKPAAKPPAKPTATKQDRLIALLRSAPGATMQQMIALTGWQPHTVRGMLSGSLRKRLGLTVQQQFIQGVRVYRIVKGSAS